MTAHTTVRFTALFTALVVTAALHGGMLFQFNRVAARAVQPAVTVITLDQVTVVGKRV